MTKNAQLSHITHELKTQIIKTIKNTNNEENKHKISYYYTTFQKDETLSKAYQKYSTEIEKFFTTAKIDINKIMSNIDAKDETQNKDTPAKTLSAIATIIATCGHYKHIDMHTYKKLDTYMRQHVTYYKDNIDQYLFDSKLQDKKKKEQKEIEQFLSHNTKNLYEFLETIYLLADKNLYRTEQLLLLTYDYTIDDNSFLDTKEFIDTTRKAIKENNKQKTNIPTPILANIFITPHIKQIANDYNCDTACFATVDMCDKCRHYREMLVCNQCIANKYFSMFKIREELIEN